MLATFSPLHAAQAARSQAKRVQKACSAHRAFLNHSARSLLDGRREFV